MSDAVNPPGQPPFRLSRESRIRVDRDGNFWHEGVKVEHKKLALGLASWLAVDLETDRYILRNALDWCFITVDDAPLVVRTVRWEGTAATVTLTDGTSAPLDFATLRIDRDDVPYCDVHDGALPARFSREAAYTLLERAEPDGDDWSLVVEGTRLPLPRVDRGAPFRKPADPPTD